MIARYTIAEVLQIDDFFSLPDLCPPLFTFLSSFHSFIFSLKWLLGIFILMGGNIEDNTVKWTTWSKLGNGLQKKKSYTGRLLPEKTMNLGPLFFSSRFQP